MGSFIAVISFGVRLPDRASLLLVSPSWARHDLWRIRRHGCGDYDHNGYCIYGAGTCNGGVGLASGDEYLAASTNGSTSQTGSANNVTFSVDGRVSSNVSITVAADHDVLGVFDTTATEPED